MKTLALQSYNFSYSTRLKFKLEEDHQFILNYNDNDQAFSIHSPWGNHAHNFEEEKHNSTEEFFQNQTKEEIFNTLIPSPEDHIKAQENYSPTTKNL